MLSNPFLISLNKILINRSLDYVPNLKNLQKYVGQWTSLKGGTRRGGWFINQLICKKIEKIMRKLGNKFWLSLTKTYYIFILEITHSINVSSGSSKSTCKALHNSERDTCTIINQYKLVSYKWLIWTNILTMIQHYVRTNIELVFVIRCQCNTLACLWQKF